MSLPSSIQFVSLFQYSPRGVEQLSSFSRDFTYAIKQDSHFRLKAQNGSIQSTHAITRVVQSIAMRMDSVPALSKCFAPSTTLVPVPRSSPMKKGWLWPGFRLCHAMKDAGLGKEVDPCLKRMTSIAKSSQAQPNERPTPQAHFKTCEVETSLLSNPSQITLVDDVITRGSMMLASYALMKQAFPECEVNCFAAVRTISDGEIEELAKPVKGTVSFSGNLLRRQP